MVKGILFFLILAVLIHLGITSWQNMNGKDRWSLTKSIGYSIIIALLAVMTLLFLVILF